MRIRSILGLCAVLALTACGRTPASNVVAAAAPSSAQPANLNDNGAILPPAAPTSAAPTDPGQASADVLPTQVGQCTQTTVKTVGTRLDGTPGSGSAIEYADGGSQVSYDQAPGIDDSQAGDAVKLCLVSIPQGCPAGDDRGKVYAGTNLRTGETWSEADSEHSCGGA
jgi:hypothetical protein